MKMVLRASLLAVVPAFGLHHRAVGGAGSNPLGAVIALMDSLQAKITKEGEVEAKTYKEFVEWCDDAAKNVRFEIKTAQGRKEKLEATIDKTAGDMQASAGKIEDLAGSVAASEADLKSAMEIRQKEASDFAASETELMDSIDSVGRAITVLGREMAKNPAAFSQVDASSTSGLLKSLTALVSSASLAGDDKQKLFALVQSQQATASDDELLMPPEASAYESHSKGILDVLEDLKEKAEEELSELRKAEVNAKHNYEMLAQSLKDQIGADTKDLNDEKSSKASSMEAKATADGDLQVTLKDLAEGQKRLEVSSSHCMTAAADHEATVKAREEELAVISKAKEILSSSSSGAVSQSYSFLQERGTARLHTRADLANAEVIALVRRLAKEHHSAALAQLASRIDAVMHFGAAAGEDPFAKVKTLITEMIAKLQASASTEATEKAYCDEQLAESETKQGELNHDLAKMTAKIDQAAASAAGLKEEVKELQEELASLVKTQAEMDKMRQESNAAFVQAKSDLELGLQGVRKALGVLREYYGTAVGDADASMLQAIQPAVPEHHEKASGAGSSIIGILEVCESDFAKNLATEETMEDDAQTAYETGTQENKITNTLKQQDVKYKTQEFKSLDKSVADLSGDRESTEAEHRAVLEYDEKLKARCIAKPETYEERKRRRKEEIEGLKDALRILEDETAFAQRGSRGKRSLRGRVLAPRQP